MTFDALVHVLLVLGAVVLPLQVEAFVASSHQHHGINKNTGSLLNKSRRTQRTILDRHDEETVLLGIPLIKSYISPMGVEQRAFKTPVLPMPVVPKQFSSKSGVVSLTEFLEGQPLQSVFESIQWACRDISKLVHKASFGDVLKESNNNNNNNDLRGLHNGGGSMNIQGEEQKKLDVLANEIMKDALMQAGTVQTIVSEEEETPISLRIPNNNKNIGSGATSKEKSYIVAFDPLDGSSNIDVGIPVGTIFGIFEHSSDGGQSLDEVLQPGNKLVGAGYCLYSAATTLVITLGDGVYGFTLNDKYSNDVGGGGGGGEFVLTHSNMKIPSRGSIYSFNEGNRWDWDEPVQDYITNLQKGTGESQRKYSGRLVGSMVADVHRTLQYGGIFGYPADAKNPNGKLRLLYEAAPMSFLVEQAGGIGTTGTRPIMNVQPTRLHERVPCILGSREDVRELESYYYMHDAAFLASTRSLQMLV